MLNFTAQRISGGSQQHCRHVGHSHSLHTDLTITQVTGRCYPRPQHTKAKSLPFRQGKSQLQEWFDHGLLSNKEMCECDRHCVYIYMCVCVCVGRLVMKRATRRACRFSLHDRIITLKSILYMSNGEQIQISLMSQINASMFNSLWHIAVKKSSDFYF